MPRRPPHFKVFVSVQNHEKMRDVYGDNDMFAMWGRIGITAIERFADRTGNSFLVHARELMGLAGCGRQDTAEKRLERLCSISPLRARREGSAWRISFSNFKRKQFGGDEEKAAGDTQNEGSGEHRADIGQTSARHRADIKPISSERSADVLRTSCSNHLESEEIEEENGAETVPSASASATATSFQRKEENTRAAHALLPGLDLEAEQPKRKASKAKTRPQSSGFGGVLIGAYKDGYRRRRGADVPINGRQKGRLKREVADELADAGKIQATVGEWFSRSERETRGWNPDAFLANWQDCWAAAQTARAKALLHDEMQAAAKAADEVTGGEELFERAGV